MKKIVCEMCGSTDLLKQNGVFVCQSCGCQYSIEEAKKLMVEVEGTVEVKGTVQIDKTSEVQKHLANARRALAKEDWDDVVRYYNLVEENDPTDIEAIFYSTYGKAKQTLTSDDFYKREQVFKSLIKSISIIDDNFNLAKEQEQKEIIIKISQAILDMASSAYVYTEVRNGYGELKDDNSIKTRQLFNDLQDEFVKTVQHIATKYDDKSKTVYLYEIIIEQSDFILKHGQLANAGGFMKLCIDSLAVLKKLDPNHHFVENNKVSNVVSKTYTFVGKNGVSADIYLLETNQLVFTTTNATDESSFYFKDSEENAVDYIALSLKKLNSLHFGAESRIDDKTKEIEKTLYLSFFTYKVGSVSIHVHADKEQAKLLRRLFEDIKKIVSTENHSCAITDVDNFSIDRFFSNDTINKSAVIGLPTKSVSASDYWGESVKIIIDSDGMLTINRIDFFKDGEWVLRSTPGSTSVLRVYNFYLWHITKIEISTTYFYISGVTPDKKNSSVYVRFKDNIPSGVLYILFEIKKRIIACGNKSCVMVDKNEQIVSSASTKGPCYVATAVYGSYDCPQVWTLRRYRDEVLGSTWYGRLFIKLYYAISPTLVKWFGKTKWFQKMWKGKLDKMVGKLNAKGFDDTPYQDKDWR